MMTGFNMRQELEWQRTAQLASWVMSPHSGKKTPTADKLLGKGKGKQRKRKVVSIEEKRATLDELEQTLGKAVNE